MSGFVAAMAAVIALAAPAAVGKDAQSAPVKVSAPTSASAPAPDTVVVTGYRDKAKVVEQFVQELSKPVGEDERFTRWNDEICPGVTGLNRADGEYVNDRIAESALQIGLKVGQPGCTPNIVVVVTPDVKTLMQALSHHRYELSGFTDVGDTTSGGGGQSVEHFIDAPKPVAWWHISERVAADTGATILGGVMRTVIQGRLVARSKEELRYVLMIVDAHQMQGVTLKSLSSYVAMASLAQLAPDAPVGKLPTIMTLFVDRDAGRTPPAGMTEWDIAYLKGLYAARDDAPDALSQRREIVHSMQTQEPAAH